MPTYKVKLLEKKEVAEKTMAFHFEKPADYKFKAGQFNDWTLINPPETDAEGNTRAFSMIGAPYEDYIGLASRMRDTAFKRTLKSMEIGAEIQLDGPMGSFTLHNDVSKPAVFLAGGIGITPFMSIVKQAAHDKLPHVIYLFYSNRRPEDAAFLQELQDLQDQNPNYHLIATMTALADSKQSWAGETGYIDQAMLTRHIQGDLTKPIYYIAGPPAMLSAMRQLLTTANINDDNIRTEEFAGY